MWAHVKFFMGVLSAIALGAGLWTAHFFRTLGYQVDGETINVAAWYDRKAEVSARIPSPRVVLAGGSNVLYGLSARQLSHQLNAPFLNFGTHGGLPLDYLLYKSKQVARPGDIIILALEYEYYSRPRGYFIGGDPSYLPHLDFPQQLQCIFSASPHSLLQPPPTKSKKYLSRLHKAREATRGRINEHGDRTGHTLASMTSHQREVVAKLKPVSSLSLQDFIHHDHNWSLLSRFAEWCANEQIMLVAVYPNTIDDPILHQDPAVQNLAKIRERFEHFGVPVLGNGTEAMRPREHFYDTVYHLSEEGQKSRSADFARMISPLIGKWKGRQSDRP
jgi:hypothetical protein